MKKKIYYLIASILFSLIVFSIIQITNKLIEYKHSEIIYSEIEENIICTDLENDTENEYKGSYIAVDFNKLKSINADTVGWLYSENTNINYPVLQGNDNNQYLRHLPTGEYSVAGTLFVDCRCIDISKEKCYIIYGHNMHDGTMFGSLTEYKNQSYYDAHPTMQYLTPEQNYTIEIVAGILVESTDEIYEVKTNNDINTFLQKAITTSYFSSNINVSEKDRIVILSTCSYEFENARFVLVGKVT